MRNLFRSLILLCALGSFSGIASADRGLRTWQIKAPFSADITEISNYKDLGLYLYQKDQKPYGGFSTLQKQLNTQCQSMKFAMNAGMFHPDYSPVGLYIENGQELKQLNTAVQGFGNFLIQPNGVLAWNAEQSAIMTTAEYALKNFKADYATQSGPMLVSGGKINANFLPDATSYKIRNGAGIKNNRLYFVISNEAVSFYQFASLFKHELSIDDALYLDGSLSSAYMPDLPRHDTFRKLGPIVAYRSAADCQKR